MLFGLWPWCSPWGARWSEIAASHLVRPLCSHSVQLVLDIVAIWNAGMDRLLLSNAVVLSTDIYASLKARYYDGQNAPPKAFIFASSGDNSREQILIGRTKTPSFEIYTEIGWVPGLAMPNQDPIFSTAASCFGGAIFIVGGMSPHGPVKDVWKFDLTRGGIWQQASPLLSPRSGAAAITSEGSLFVIGGHDGRKALDTGERIDGLHEEWQSIPKLNEARHLCRAEVLCGQILVIGGNNSGGYLNTTELFNGNTWSFGPSMLRERCSFGSAVWRGHVVVLGGDDGWNRLDSAEILTGLGERWRACGRLSWGRSGCAAFVLQDQLFVLGGYDGLEPKASMEIYEYDWVRNGLDDARSTPYTPVKGHALNTQRNCLNVSVAYNHGTSR